MRQYCASQAGSREAAAYLPVAPESLNTLPRLIKGLIFKDKERCAFTHAGLEAPVKSMCTNLKWEQQQKIVERPRSLAALKNKLNPTPTYRGTRVSVFVWNVRINRLRRLLQ